MGHTTFAAIVLGLAMPLIAPLQARAEAPAPARHGKHVLLLYSHENAMYSQFDAPLRAALSNDVSYPVDFFTEYLDLIRFPRQRYEQQVVDFLRAKYADRSIDLIVVVSPLAFDFVLERGRELFPAVPVVFASINAATIAARSLPPNVTGVAVTRDFKDTLNLALDVHPDTTLVVVPAGSSATERLWVADARKDFEASYAGRVAFTYLSGLPIDEILRRVQSLPPHALVLVSPMLYSDSNGSYFRPEQLAGLFAAASNAPVYGTDAQFLGTGIVGGSLYDMTAVGIAAGDMGRRILNGEPPARIAVRTMNPNRPMFDARQLARWQIADSRLPAGAVLMYRTPTLWSQYRGYVVAAASALLAQSALVSLLLVQRLRRRRVERALRDSETAVRASYAEVQHLVGRLITAQESERRRIARDLHDDLSQKLALLGIEIARLDRVGQDPGDLAEAVRDLSARMGALAGDVHRLSHDLHPAKLDLIGLVPAIQGLCREMSHQHDIRIECRGGASNCGLSPSASLCLFRIAQEALHNIVKHSGARTAIVRLRRTGNGLRLHLADDGAGFDSRRRRGGLGLLSMRERVLFANGTIAIRSAPGRGTHVVVTLPIHEEIADHERPSDYAYSA